MAVCWFCKKNVGDDCESVTIGIRKTNKPICDVCSRYLKNIINRNDVNEALKYFEAHKSEMDSKAIKYIEKLAAKKDSNIKSYGKMYYVDKLPFNNRSLGKSVVPVVFPKQCNCCMAPTTSTETLHAKDIGGYGINTKRIMDMHLKIPLCRQCSSTRGRPSAKITSYSMDFNTFGMLFTNKEYAELFAKLNNKTVSELEDRGSVSSMSWFGDEENIKKLIKWAIYIVIALLIIWRLG